MVRGNGTPQEGEAMARAMRLRWMALGSLICVSPGVRAEEAPQLPREVREIQRTLGGPAVDQFPSLQPIEQGMWPNWSSTPYRAVTPAVAMATDDRLRTQINSLRETAAQLDGSANRLEALELYQQADALRNVAQRLRMEARSMGRSEAPSSWDAPAERPRRIARPSEVRPGEEGRAGRRARRERPSQPSPEPRPVAPTAEATDN
jgi:hypothetical protein